MKNRIMRISALQAGMMMGLISGLFAVIMLPLLLIAPAFGGKIDTADLVKIILSPIIGFVSGILFASLYNLATKFVGGLEITIEAADPYFKS